jgi:hypothetical protein
VSTQRARKGLNSAGSGAREKSGYHDQLLFLLEQRYPREFLEQVKKHDIQFARLEGLDLEEAKRVCQL